MRSGKAKSKGLSPCHTPLEDVLMDVMLTGMVNGREVSSFTLFLKASYALRALCCYEKALHVCIYRRGAR